MKAATIKRKVVDTAARALVGDGRLPSDFRPRLESIATAPCCMAEPRRFVLGMGANDQLETEGGMTMAIDRRI